MVDPLNWTRVFETFIGTTAGATVGIGGIIWQTKLQSKEKYSMRLTQEMARVAQLIADQLAKSSAGGFSLIRRQQKQTILSENRLVGFALVVAATFAKGNDLKVVLAMQHACFNELNNTLEIHTQMRVDMAGTIAGWRTNLKPVDYYLENLKKI